MPKLAIVTMDPTSVHGTVRCAHNDQKEEIISRTAQHQGMEATGRNVNDTSMVDAFHSLRRVFNLSHLSQTQLTKGIVAK
jgi:hypothetical protein